MKIHRRPEGYRVIELNLDADRTAEEYVYVVRQEHHDDCCSETFASALHRDLDEALRAAERQYLTELHEDNVDRLASNEPGLRGDCAEIMVVAWPFDRPGTKRWAEREIALYRITPDYDQVAVPRLTGEEFLTRARAAKSGAADAFDGVEIPTAPGTLVTILTEAGLDELDEATDILYRLVKNKVGPVGIDWIWNTTLDHLREAAATPVDRALAGFWRGLDDAAAALTQAEQHRKALTGGLHPDYAGSVGEDIEQALAAAGQAVRAVNDADPLERPTPC